MQNFGVTNKEYYGVLWYFLEWSIVIMQGPFGHYTPPNGLLTASLQT